MSVAAKPQIAFQWDRFSTSTMLFKARVCATVEYSNILQHGQCKHPAFFDAPLFNAARGVRDLAACWLSACGVMGRPGKHDSGDAILCFILGVSMVCVLIMTFRRERDA